MFKFKKRDKKNKNFNVYELGYSLPADKFRPLFEEFSEKFKKDGMDPFSDESSRLDGVNVDDLNFDRRDKMLDAESKLEESIQKEGLLEAIRTIEVLMSEKFAEVVVLLEKESILNNEKKIVEKEIEAFEKCRKEWLRNGKVTL